MVLSKINKEVSYKDTKKIEEDDIEHASPIYSIFLNLPSRATANLSSPSQATEKPSNFCLCRLKPSKILFSNKILHIILFWGWETTIDNGELLGSASLVRNRFRRFRIFAFSNG